MLEQSKMIYLVYLQIKLTVDKSDVRYHVQPLAEQLQPRTRR